MSKGPRRRRANAWVWVYLALFGSDGEAETTPDDSTPDVESTDANDEGFRRSDPRIELLPYALDNLLENAVEHNDSDPPLSRDRRWNPKTRPRYGRNRRGTA